MGPVTAPGRVAILAHTFPLHSATFIANEVRELRRRGLDPALLAIRAPGPADAPPEMDDLRRATRYLLPIGPLVLARAHAAALLRRPGGYLRALGRALTIGRLPLRHRLRTLVHFAEAVALLPILEATGCRHLHVHALSGVATIALLLRDVGGPEYSLTAHGTDIFVERVLLAEKIGGARFTRVGTRFNRDHLGRVHGADVDRIHVAPFGVDVDRFRPESTAGEGGPGAIAGDPAATGATDTAGDAARDTLRLVTVGRLVWQKAHHLLLGACARLRAQGVDVRLTIVGEGDERPALEARRRSLGLEEVVDLPGAGSEDDVARALGRADLFVLSSVSEGFGMVLLEAMACGRPVVAPALNGIPEVVTDGVEGRLFPPGSEEGLAAAIGELAADPALRRRMGEAGRRRVVASFRLRDRVAAFEQLLRASAGAVGR